MGERTVAPLWGAIDGALGGTLNHTQVLFCKFPEVQKGFTFILFELDNCPLPGVDRANL